MNWAMQKQNLNIYALVNAYVSKGNLLMSVNMHKVTQSDYILVKTFIFPMHIVLPALFMV